MDFLSAHRTGYNLHRLVANTPSPDSYTPHTAAPEREQRGVPPEQSLSRQRHAGIYSGVSHNLDKSLNIMVSRDKSLIVKAQFTRYRASYRIRIERYPLNSGRTYQIGGHCVKSGIPPALEAEHCHRALELPLQAPNLCQRRNQPFQIPRKPRPFFTLPDITRLSFSIFIHTANITFRGEKSK